MKTGAPAKQMSVFSVLRALQRRKLFLLLPVVVLTPAVAFYVMKMPQLYRAQALVGSEPMVQDRLTFGQRTEAVALPAQDEMRAIRQTLMSDAVLTKVIDEFHLYPAATRDEQRKAIDAMKEQIRIQIEGTNAFYIQFQGKNPNQVTQVANRLAALFTQQTATIRDTHADLQDSFLDKEVADAKARLDKQEEALKSYRQSGAQQVPERFADNLKEFQTLQEQIRNKDDQITEAEAKKSADMAELSAIEKQGALDPEPQEKSLVEIQIDEQKRKVAQLRARYTPEHPEVIRAQSELRDLQASAPAKPAVTHRPASQIQMRYLALQAELKSLDPKIASYRQDRSALAGQVQGYQRIINSSPAYATALTDRMRDSNDARTSYETLLAKQQEARLNHRVQKDADGVAYKVLEPAEVPAAPFSPHRSRMILLAFAASLAMGFVGIVVAERLDTSFETSEDFEAYTDIPLLSAIPSIATPLSGKQRAGRVTPIRPSPANLKGEAGEHFQNNRLAVLTDPDSIAAQQYNILALKVQKWMSRTGGKTLVITSSTGEEGKSLTALNLSLALASSMGGGVLLVDCDLRLPQIQNRLGLQSDPGLADLLVSGSSDASPYISRIGDLDVMPAGTNAVQQTRLLASARGHEVMAKLRDQYRIVVLDSPPVVPISDSHTLSGLADGVVMVVRARRTRPELLQRALASLEAQNLVGVVLNDVELNSTPYAYAYRYYQQHYLKRS
ncbi:MAG: AAA family ATPase [Acidobacteriota bacterium]|nr:AAA family ATPase [Acidobacteriota bacterium]